MHNVFVNSNWLTINIDRKSIQMSLSVNFWIIFITAKMKLVTVNRIQPVYSHKEFSFLVPTTIVFSFDLLYQIVGKISSYKKYLYANSLNAN